MLTTRICCGTLSSKGMAEKVTLGEWREHGKVAFVAGGLNVDGHHVRGHSIFEAG